MIFLCRLWGSPGPKNDIESKFYCFMSFFGVRPDPNLRVGLALGGRETIEKGGEGRGGRRDQLQGQMVANGRSRQIAFRYPTP